MTEEQLLRHTPDGFKAYRQAQEKLLEKRLGEDIERDVKERLEAEQARLAAMDKQQREVHDARKHITDELLTLRCPRCRAAFLDFSGCFALTCGRCQPRCGFCAFCLEDCGEDAHRHVANCPLNAIPGKGVFGSQQDFEQGQLKRRKDLVIEHLRTIDDQQVRDQVIDQCRTDLEDLQMHDVLRQFAGPAGGGGAGLRGVGDRWFARVPVARCTVCTMPLPCARHGQNDEDDVRLMDEDFEFALRLQLEEEAGR